MRFLGGRSYQGLQAALVLLACLAEGRNLQTTDEKYEEHLIRLKHKTHAHHDIQARNLHVEKLPLPAKAFGSQVWNESLHIYSALRNAAEVEIAIIYDAEIWLEEHMNCYFVSGALPSAANEPAQREVQGDCKLLQYWGSGRRSEGWLMRCKDPGPEFDTVVFRTANTGMSPLYLWVAFHMEMMETRRKGSVGACLTSMYSQPPIPLELWLTDSFSLGVSGISVYYTDFRLNDSAMLVNGVGIPYAHDDFIPVPFANVDYNYFLPPVGRYYFSSNTIQNECIYRNRHAYEYLVMADADEFLTMRYPDQTLEAVLQSLFGENAHSILLQTHIYPAFCQSDESDSVFAPHVTSARDNAHWFSLPDAPYSNPKSIVRPRWVHGMAIHWVINPARNTTIERKVDGMELYFKHIRGGTGKCYDKSSLVDDRDWNTVDEHYKILLEKDKEVEGLS